MGSIPGRKNTQGLEIIEKVHAAFVSIIPSRGSDDHVNGGPVPSRPVSPHYTTLELKGRKRTTEDVTNLGRDHPQCLAQNG